MVYFKETGRIGEPFLVAPSSVLWLIGVILALHGIRVILPGNWPEILVEIFAFVPGHFSIPAQFYASSKILLLVTFFSHVFLHGNWAHAGINSLWLLAFGPVVARRLGTGMFLIFFFVCAIAGALAQLLVYWGSDDAVIGASGAIAGLMGAGIRMVYGRTMGLRLAPLFSSQMLSFSLMWIIVNIVTGVIGIGTGPDIQLIAWVVHLGGYFAGVLTIGLFDSRRNED